MISSEAIPPTMQAAVLEGPKCLRVNEIPVWGLEEYGDPDMVLLKVAACGVCGSDFRYFVGENPWAQNTLGRFIPNPPNIVPGHEYAGTVVQVLDERNRHLLGKRVVPLCFKVCGACDDCRAGRSRLCVNMIHMGHGQGWGVRDFYPGAYANYVPSWGATCFEIPDNISFEEAAMMDILAVGVHVAEQGNIQPGRPILCIGAGPVGNAIAQVSLGTGASRAVLLERSAKAIDIAREQGIGLAIDTSGMTNAEIGAELHRVAPDGFGSVFDTVGTAESLDLGLTVLGKAGTLVNLAIHDTEVPINFLRLGSERKIVTSCNFEVGDYPRALAWLEAGRLRVKEWLTDTALSDLPGHFGRITSNPAEKGVFKLLVRP